MWWWRGELSETARIGGIYMERNSVVWDTSRQSKTGREAGPTLKAKGSGSLRGCSVKGNVSATTQLKACKSTEDRVWIIHQQEKLQCVAKHAAELHVETPARQGCKDAFFEFWSHHWRSPLLFGWVILFLWLHALHLWKEANNTWFLGIKDNNCESS